MKKITRDIEFFYEIGALRFLQRNWKQFLNPDFQNISEHTLRVILIALILAKYEKKYQYINISKYQHIDEEKILKMALVHDLPESRSGDVHYVSRQYTKRFEEKAIKDILKNTALENEFLKIWREYEKRESLEAKIVKDADHLDVNLELIEAAAVGHKLKNIFEKKREKTVYPKLYTKTAQKFWKAIKRSNPHSWHLNAKNRFNEGDWKK